jgi:hypothetical protein
LGMQNCGDLSKDSALYNPHAESKIPSLIKRIYAIQWHDNRRFELCGLLWAKDLLGISNLAIY